MMEASHVKRRTRTRTLERSAVAIAIGTAVVLPILDQRTGVPVQEPAHPPGIERSEHVTGTKLTTESDRIPEHPHGLAEERRRQRAGEDGQIPIGALASAKDQVDRMRSGQRDAGIWNWDWLGPGNIGGRVRALHIESDGTLWIGGVTGGLWKRPPTASSWQLIDDFMANLGVTSIVQDPFDAEVLYASTGEGFLSGGDQLGGGLPGAGIFKSTNHGSTWFQLSSTDNEMFRWVTRLAHHPARSGELWATTRSDDWTVHPHTVWRSTDGGLSWDSALATTGPALDIEIHPTSANRILVGTSSDGYYSPDDGASWTSFRSTPGFPVDPGRCEVAFHQGSAHMYISMQRNDGEIWRSTDDTGSLWTRQCTGYGYLSNSAGNIGDYANAIWVAPQTFPFDMVVGGLDLWRSDDEGVTLTKISDWHLYHVDGSSAHADQHAIVPIPGYGGSDLRVYVGNDGGVQMVQNIRTATETSWTNLADNLGITQFYGGASDPAGTVIIGGTQDNSTLRLTGGGTGSWFQAESGDGGYCAVDFNDPSILYGEYINLQIKRSDDGGATWASKVTGLGDAGVSALFIAPFTMDPVASHVLYAGGKSIWKTSDYAESWYEVRSPVPSDAFCSAIDVAQSDRNFVWVGYDDGTLGMSGNGGTTWTTIAGPVSRWVTDIAICPDEVNIVAVTYSRYEPDNVWVTFDGGSTWVQRSGDAPDDLPAIPVNTIQFHPANTDWMYAGTDLGVFASENRGQRWSVMTNYPANEGPANVEVDDLFWCGDNLIAATHGRGMFRCRPLDVVYVDEQASGFENGSMASPYDTVGEAIDAAGIGTTIAIRPGTYTEAPIAFYKHGRVTGWGPGVVEIK